MKLNRIGLETLKGWVEKLRKQKKHLILCGPRAQPLFALERTGFMDLFARETVCADIDSLLERESEILRPKAAVPNRQ